MSSSTCPNGHPTASSDYCDTCGAPIDQTQAPDVSSPSGSDSPPGTYGDAPDGATADVPGAPAAAHTSATQCCPNCTLANTADALFCEGCGYAFTTGTMPRAATPTNSLDLGAAPAQPTVPDSVAPSVAVRWVAEVWVDPDWYADQDSDEPCPSPGLPVVCLL